MYHKDFMGFLYHLSIDLTKIIVSQRVILHLKSSFLIVSIALLVSRKSLITENNNLH
jgi:hypothetical protein